MAGLRGARTWFALALATAVVAAGTGVGVWEALRSHPAPAGGPVTGPAGVTISASGPPLGTISRYLFGANLLWADGAEGTFDAPAGRFYPQFVAEVRQVGVTALRYPGGTTSDSFFWLRAIGPPSRRGLNEPYGMQYRALSPVCCVLDGPQPSSVGPDEFGQLLDETHAIGNITVNFGTGTAAQAADFVAYMTAPLARHPSKSPGQRSYWAALRARDGHPAPYDVPYWEVGNEQDSPGQYSWRSGQFVSFDGKYRCSVPDLPACLYAFGGTTRFSRQPLGRFADDLPAAAVSTGAPGQAFYAYFPPVVPDSQTVYVNGEIWHQVKDLAKARPGARVYVLQASAGRVGFGDGRHGAVPPRGSRVAMTYQSGPHQGFIEFYRAIKKMAPHVQVCEAEQHDTAFLEVMSKKHRYDCVELHQYAKPVDISAPIEAYEESLLRYPLVEAAGVAALQRDVRRWSGRNVPIVLTEYGQLIAPEPLAAPHFNLSLDEGVLVASQLAQWARLGVPLAEKYLLDGMPIKDDGQLAVSGVAGGLSVDNGMVAALDPDFILEPSGLAVELMSRFGGAQRLRAQVGGDPTSPAGRQFPLLSVLAAKAGDRVLLAVINGGPAAAVTARLDLRSVARRGPLTVTVLDGPSAVAYNSRSDPGAVALATRSLPVANPVFSWSFPPHSVTLFEAPSA